MSKIFISHVYQDKQQAAEIAKLLAAEGLEPWIDVHEITPGVSFLERMNEGLKNASYLLLMLSSASVSSRWVTKEWMAALASRDTVVVPVLLESIELPPLLRDVVFIDFRDRARGLEQLRRYFTIELRPLQSSAPSEGTTRSGIWQTLTPREIRLIAIACVTPAALDAFLIDAEISPGEIGGASLNERIHSLLHKLQRDNVATNFAEWLSLEEPRCFDRGLTRIRSGPRWTMPLS
jgi:hypothetical protein